MPGWRPTSGSASARSSCGTCERAQGRELEHSLLWHRVPGLVPGVPRVTHYVKVTSFRGTLLRPLPPGGTVRSKDARWIDIREGDQLDEAQMANWVKQAAALPGWVP